MGAYFKKFQTFQSLANFSFLAQSFRIATCWRFCCGLHIFILWRPSWPPLCWLVESPPPLNRSPPPLSPLAAVQAASAPPRSRSVPPQPCPYSSSFSTIFSLFSLLSTTATTSSSSTILLIKFTAALLFHFFSK
jgi:hypothetical protein